MISQHPWGVGIGERAFGSIYPHFAVSGTENVMHTHQIFLQLLTEVGISGLVMFLLILVCLFLSVLYGATHLEASARGELLGGGCGILGVLVMGLFDHVSYHRGMLALFWILAAFVSAPLVEGKYKRREWN